MNCQSAGRGVFAEQSNDVGHDGYASSCQTLSNDDCEQLVPRLISPCIYWDHHSDNDCEVGLNSIDSMNVLTTNLDTEKDVSALFTIGHDRMNLL